MNIIKAILFGIVEGITEWMPVSSTAHMKILNAIIPLEVSPEFYEVFEVVIQLGAIIALVIVFWNKIWPFGESKNPLGEGILSIVKKDKFFLWIKIVIACIPVILYELLLEDRISFINEKNEMIFIGAALIIVGIIFIVVEMLIKGKKPKYISTKQITFMQAFIIGMTQLIAAIFPGVSRSGSTIIAALLLGISRSCATEFTFELAIPVMFGASLMKILKFSAAVTFGEIMTLLVGCISAFLVSLFMIRFMLNYIRKNTFTMFGIYRILLGIIILVFLR
ncbi:MAG: undecaprenyl-diphosphate phosphatase [Erysipelotrichaceae bacterium]|nr:undecaprenyl-diphosphate phosphatase [Erysipelotrichaceae bacterium]MBQ6494148.1 undecaprenyl-diphosphate phosphatase [Erysipelotrichaceae bacterium]